jgi:hypothetical protein
MADEADIAQIQNEIAEREADSLKLFCSHK